MQSNSVELIFDTVSNFIAHYCWFIDSWYKASAKLDFKYIQKNFCIRCYTDCTILLLLEKGISVFFIESLVSLYCIALKEKSFLILAMNIVIQR